MIEREVIASLLRGVSAILARQDAERQAFEAQFLKEFGDVRRLCERNHELLTEIHQFLASHVKKQNELEQDLEQHVKDRARHVAA